MSIGDDGWLVGDELAVRHAPSPNFDERPDASGDLATLRRRISLVVIHAISLPPGQFGGDAIEQFFLNQLDPAAHPYFQTIASVKVSAHFLIRRDGEVIQFVALDKRAWHAGVSSWRGRERCNDFSIGIELEGCDEQPFADAQYIALNRLIAVLAKHYAVRDIAGHSDIAPGRKTDPGPGFDWQRVNAKSEWTSPDFG